jgi:glycosyltransferase involved in cell wall biosynthesis
MSKISIIVPVYNVEAYLRRCLDSLVNQTLKDIEIIIVNDGSKDNSQSIIDEYAKKDERIKALIKKNGGLSDARNFGMKYAKGEYLAFVDSDDYVDLDMYENMYNKSLTDKADIVECDFIWEYPQKNKIDKSKIDKNMIISTRVVAWNKIYRRNLIANNKIDFPIGLRYEDVLFCYKLLPYVKSIAYVDKPFYHYIQRPGSIANTQNEKVRDIYKILELVIQYYKDKKIYEKYHDQLEFIYMRYIFGSSFKRAIKIENKKLRYDVLREGFDLLNINFPNWHKNKYLKQYKGLKNIYFKTINKYTYFLYAFIFRIAGFDK